MDITDYLRFIAALIFVLALIGLATWVARRYGFGGRVSPLRQGDRRVQVVEITTIDSKHRAVLIRRDATEHLVLLGANDTTVVETGIPAPTDATGATDSKSEQSQ